MIEVRKAERSDIETMARFQVAMAAETEDVELSFDTLCEGMESVYDNPSRGEYYVAEYEGRVVGSLMITYEWSEWRNKNIYWIQSVYVVPEARGMGIYKSLYEHVKIQVEKDPALGGIRLYVHNSNTNAQKVYSKLGMSGESYRIFEWMKD